MCDVSCRDDSALEQRSPSHTLLGDACGNGNEGRTDMAEDVLKGDSGMCPSRCDIRLGGGLAPEGLTGRLERRSLRYSFSHAWWVWRRSSALEVDEEAKNFNGEVRARRLGIEGRPGNCSAVAEVSWASIVILYSGAICPLGHRGRSS